VLPFPKRLFPMPMTPHKKKKRMDAPLVRGKFATYTRGLGNSVTATLHEPDNDQSEATPARVSPKAKRAAAPVVATATKD
jgi:hypothetical protein